MPVSSSTEHWIKPDALTINLNHFGDPDYLQVSVLAGAVVMAFKQDVIGYNAAHNYRTWPLDAANTYLETTSAYNVYARLTRSEVNARALIVYDTVLRDIEGREITYAEDGSEVLGDANPDYFFVFLGQISASVNSVGDSIQREWVSSILFGTLNTNQFQNTESGGEWTKMFRLNKVTDLIDVLKTFSFAIFRKLSIKKGETEKIITDLKRSIDTDEDVPISDETIPTTKYLASVTDNRFLRKDKDDRSVGMIASDKGFEVGVFQQGELGSGGIFKIDEEGNSYLEVDKALFRKIAYFVEIMIKKLSHVGGSIILSHASMRCSKVETFATYYRCYFESEQEGKVIAQEFVVGDQARSQTFNIKEGLSQNVSNQYYWRLVVGVGDNYIDLSIADCDSGSGVPQAGDDIVLLGNRNDASRQNAIILSSYGEGTPSFRQYKGIKTYSLADAQMTTEFSPESNLIIGKFITESGKSIEDELGEVKVNWDKVLSQTDKEFTMWFFDYSPSADMLPESDWTTDDLKALHEEDLFYNTNVDHEDGGKAWRYVYDENLGKYVWEIVTDAETIKALEKASDAQKTADLKIRNFVSQPVPPYDEGDRWSNATYGELFDDDDLVCVNPKADGESFSIEDWRPVAYGKTSIIKNMEGEIQLLAASFELGTDGKYYLSKEAGVNITTEMASIYATKTQYNTLANKVASNTTRIDTTAESLSAFTEKISFDSSGNVSNISKSGLVTTSNHATLFASEVTSQKIATQSYVRAQVSDGISNITIGADKIEFLGKTIINGNFIVDTSGNLTINGTINAESGLIAGFKIAGASLTNEGFDNDASLIFRNDEYGLFAGIGGSVIPSFTGLKGVARFENHDSTGIWGGTTNYSLLVSAQNAYYNEAISILGGYISGFALKTQIVSSSAGNLIKTIDDGAGVVLVTGDGGAYLTLPDIETYDDGHVVKIKRISKGEVRVKAGNSMNYAYGFHYKSSSDSEKINISSHNLPSKTAIDIYVKTNGKSNFQVLRYTSSNSLIDAITVDGDGVYRLGAAFEGVPYYLQISKAGVEVTCIYSGMSNTSRVEYPFESALTFDGSTFYRTDTLAAQSLLIDSGKSMEFVYHRDMTYTYTDSSSVEHECRGLWVAH